MICHKCGAKIKAPPTAAEIGSKGGKVLSEAKRAQLKNAVLKRWEGHEKKSRNGIGSTIKYRQKA